MAHLTITAECTGDAITAISHCVDIAKAYKDVIYLKFPEGFSISVRPTSDTSDLVKIYMLELRQKETNAKLLNLFFPTS